MHRDFGLCLFLFGLYKIKFLHLWVCKTNLQKKILLFTCLPASFIYYTVLYNLKRFNIFL